MTFAFHISREARERYNVSDELFTLTGNVVLPDIAAGRRLAQRLNERMDPAADPGQFVHAGELNAMGLLDEILHAIVAMYREQINPRAMAAALVALDERLGTSSVQRTLEAFVSRFPTAQAHREGIAPAAYLAATTDGMANREIAVEELLMLWLANANPALTAFKELFDDAPLAAAVPYGAVVSGLIAHFGSQPPFGPDGQTLIELLRAPSVEVPDSIAGQLRFVRERWNVVITRFGDRLVLNLDVLAEEEQAIWRQFHPAGGGMGGGGSPEEMARRAGRAWLTESGWYRSDDGAGDNAETLPEPEQFSVDKDWMPRLVLIAKSSFVWLDQLSKTYGRPINRLDEIPDEELDKLARWGFTGLWLIGLWQRSRASQTIKQLRGNPEAVASAYSLDDYRIADDLGGEEAFERLKARAWARGIRMASDMVPNHMGVDSRWVMEHPDWFMSLPEPPYPAYTFTGPDLSADPRTGIQIEDHYFNNTDAAVVFKRWDRATGEARYLYHGNDGTSMPWNDTAQLDYIQAGVREAVIQTILAVARRSPVIRFDAAMTLAKRHIERLWYPEPGHGGGIPSRAEHAMAKAEFERLMPVEFWREVVDRVAAEVPDTLLLAEAFWLMEGYFVRTLGMHRVYNSAFMHMMRDEQNAEYRVVVKNTIEFDPEVLKRYVNFMNNPDERTAVDQFGKGDKYIGVATLMATLPGLPMFGHGQVEGFTEKYGMEYRRAYWDERPDSWLMERHEREIAPLLQRRQLFAEVDDFLFFDFLRADGSVDEDVFAYSNRGGGETSLIVYNNRYGSTSGSIHLSTTFAARTADGTREPMQRSLADGLGLHGGGTWFVVLRDWRTGLESLQPSGDVRASGLRVDLDAYACRVFIGIREVEDAPGRPWGRLAADLGGGGVPSLEDALRDLLVRPIQEPVQRLLEPARLRRLATVPVHAAAGDLLDDVAAILRAAAELAGGPSSSHVAAAAAVAQAIAVGLTTPRASRADATQSADAERRPPADAASHRERSAEARHPGGSMPSIYASPMSQVPASDAAEAWDPHAWGAASASAAAPTSGAAAAPASSGVVSSSAPGMSAVAGSAAAASNLAASVAVVPTSVEDVLRAAWLLFHHAPDALGSPGDTQRARAWIDAWRLAPVVAGAFRVAGLEEAHSWRAVEALKALLTLPAWDLGRPPAAMAVEIVQLWLADDAVARVLQVNVHRDVRWFNKEAFEEFAAWSAVIAAIRQPREALSGSVLGATVAAMTALAATSGYRVDLLGQAAGRESGASTAQQG